jgi:predicted nucleic acid-binding protein
LTRYVLDVSVAVKWVLPEGERLREQANGVLLRYVANEIELITPDLFLPECGNVLWKAARTGRMTQAAAADAWSAMRGLQLTSVSTRELGEVAMKIACQADRTFYDSLYVALAVREECSLVTADERLAHAMERQWPVVWLGTL